MHLQLTAGNVLSGFDEYYFFSVEIFISFFYPLPRSAYNTIHTLHAYAFDWHILNVLHGSMNDV